MTVSTTPTSTAPTATTGSAKSDILGNFFPNKNKGAWSGSTLPINELLKNFLYGGGHDNATMTGYDSLIKSLGDPPKKSTSASWLSAPHWMQWAEAHGPTDWLYILFGAVLIIGALFSSVMSSRAATQIISVVGAVK
jgi:hypothetical protein